MIRTDKHAQMMKALEDEVKSVSISYFKCSGHQNEHSSELELEEFEVDNVDEIVRNILGVVADYISEWLL